MNDNLPRRLAGTAVSLLLSASLLTAAGCTDNGADGTAQTEATAAVTEAHKDTAEEKDAEDAGEETTEKKESDDNDTANAAPSPVEYYGEMIVKGNEIVGAKTDSCVQVTGMSFFWSNWSQRFYTAEMVEKMADEYSCEVVRASYGIQDSGVPHDKSDVDRIKTVVDAAIDNGVYVILDWHSHGAQNNPEEAVDFFGMMAEEYGSYDNVIFELYNEPKNVDWPTVKEYAEIVIPEIRKHSDNLIIVGSPTWSQDVDIASEDPVDGENIAYALHFYAGTHKASLRSKAERALDNGIALFVTEWGSVDSSGNGAIDYDSTAEWINWMNENNISWCNWAVNDKDESSSIFNTAGDYTEAGNLLKYIISECNSNSEWKTGTQDEDKPFSFDREDYKVVEKPREIKTHSLPGKVEAEDYSEMDGIQLEGCGEGGQNIGYIETGDSISYSVDVKTAGEYTVSFRVASQDGGGVISLESEDGEVASAEVPKTGDWQSWETITVKAELEAGEQELTIGVPSGGFNVNWIEFAVG